MSQPLNAETVARAKDLRDMGATWSKVVELTGVPRIVLKRALRAAILPALVTHVDTGGTATIVRSLRDEMAP